jgi:hypothetical protein
MPSDNPIRFNLRYVLGAVLAISANLAAGQFQPLLSVFTVPLTLLLLAALDYRIAMPLVYLLAALFLGGLLLAALH